MSAVELMLLHGAGGGAWQWSKWEAVLAAEGFSCQALELQPRAELKATTLADYQAQVSAAVGACVRPPVLVGASLGGLLALGAAAQTPITALVLVNAVPPAGTPGWPSAPRRFPRVIRWREGAPQTTRLALPDATWEVAETVHRQWRNESGAVMQTLWDGVVLAHGPQVPSLILAGSLDTTVLPETQAALARRLGGDFYQAVGVSHLGALLGQRAPRLAALAATWLRAI